MYKKPINIVCLGHVDSGKSTFIGSLLSGIGLIPQKIIQKNLVEARKIKKESFFLAWNTDEMTQERKRGITMDISNQFFETEKYYVTIIDCPGHKSYIPNTVSGVTQAEVAILIIDAVDIIKTPIESGQTYEHVHLARIFGIVEIIVCINKMDLIDYSEEGFKTICNLLKPLFKKMGIKDDNIFYIPISAKNSVNIANISKESLPWYSGQCVFKTIDLLKGSESLVSLPLRISVSSSFQIKAKNFQVFGKIESGELNTPCDCLLCPMNETVTLTNLVDREGTVEAGHQITMIVKTFSEIDIPVGATISDMNNPPVVTDTFLAHVGIFEISKPLLKGCKLKLHSLQCREDVYIMTISNYISKKTGDVKNPRMMSSYSQADIVFRSERQIAFDPFEKNKATGRFVLRIDDATIGTGKFISQS